MSPAECRVQTLRLAEVGGMVEWHLAAAEEGTGGQSVLAEGTACAKTLEWERAWGAWVPGHLCASRPAAAADVPTG